MHIIMPPPSISYTLFSPGMFPLRSRLSPVSGAARVQSPFPCSPFYPVSAASRISSVCGCSLVIWSCPACFLLALYCFGGCG